MDNTVFELELELEFERFPLFTPGLGQNVGLPALPADRTRIT